MRVTRTLAMRVAQPGIKGVLQPLHARAQPHAYGLLLSRLTPSPPLPYQPMTLFSTKKVVDVRHSAQRECWEKYLASATNSDDLFAELDLNFSGTISVQEINYFLDSVEQKGVSSRAFATLQRLGEDHKLDAKEFKQWLNMATSGSGTPPPPQKQVQPELEEAKEGVTAPEKTSVDDVRHGLQNLVWKDYLSFGHHESGCDLFHMIDLDKNGNISVSEIKYFIESVGRKGVKEKEFDELLQMGDDHELDEEEFLEWLVSAADVEEHGDARFGASGCTPGQW